MGSGPCHAENRTTAKVSDHAEVSRNFLHYAPFHRSWFIQFLAKTEFRQIRMSRETEMERNREMGKCWGGRERKRERDGEAG